MPNIGSSLTRPRAVIAVGLTLLIFSGGVVSADLGAQTNYYYVGYIELEDNEYTVSEEITTGYDQDVLCWGSDSRDCVLEQSLLENPVNIPSDRGSPRVYEQTAEHQFVAHDGEFYEPTVSDEQLRLAPVPATEVFERSAIDGDDLPAGVMEQLTARTERIGTHTDLPDQQLIALGDGRYATLNHDTTSRTAVDTILALAELPLAASGFILGILLILRS